MVIPVERVFTAQVRPFDIQVLVPHGRTVWLVEASDGVGVTNAVKMSTLTPPGSGYSIEIWQAYLLEPPTKITTHLSPASRS